MHCLPPPNYCENRDIEESSSQFLKENVTRRPTDISADYMSNFKAWLATGPVRNAEIPDADIKLPNSFSFANKKENELAGDNVHLPKKAVYTFAAGSSANIVFASMFVYYYLSGNNKWASWSLFLLLISMLFVWKSINEAREFKEKNSVS